MSPDDLVEQLGDKRSRLDAIGQLMGGVNARELRHALVNEDVFEALVRGTCHRSDVVRWWSVQLLDHCPDERAFDAVVPLLDDAIDRVRRNAVHALGCRVCKPSSDASPDSTVMARLQSMAAQDVNAKVRREASATLDAIVASS
jgi:HEAT repeat protein